MLTIVGGTYLEVCQEPYWNQLYGSGLRAAVALSGNVPSIDFLSCIGEDFIQAAEGTCAAFGIVASFTPIPRTVSFRYHHPLAQPFVYPDVFNLAKVTMPDVEAETILLYGLAEAQVQVKGNYVVYDPQNRVPFRNSGATADHLALVLNRTESLLLSGLSTDTNLVEVGQALLKSEGAEVVVIKNGAHGAWVIESTDSHWIPLFKTPSVWSVGSGDIFSAVFAWKWAIEKLPATEAAHWASRFTAHYCQRKEFSFPLPAAPALFEAANRTEKGRKVYLAGPFFTMAERWLTNELRDKLLEFGNAVFSPLHDVGHGPPNQVVGPDLEGIRNAEVMIAVATGLDAGTLFEIGYAKALGKRVIVLAENTAEADLTMLIGTGCEITADFTTAVYQASW